MAVNDIHRFLLGEIDADTALARETLKAAVMRRITCPQSGRVLDVRTAVYFHVTAAGGTAGAEVVDGPVWDGPYGAHVRAACGTGRVTLDEVIDGRPVNAVASGPEQPDESVYLEPVGTGGRAYGPYPDEVAASDDMDARGLGDDAYKLVWRPGRP